MTVAGLGSSLLLLAALALASTAPQHPVEGKSYGDLIDAGLY
jgi:hypothetical protein